MQTEDSKWRFSKQERIRLFDVFREEAVEAVSSAVLAKLLAQEGKAIRKWYGVRRHLETRVKKDEAEHLTTRVQNRYPIEDRPEHFDLITRYAPYRNYSLMFLETIVNFLDGIHKPEGFTVLQANCLTGTEIRVLAKFYHGLDMHFEGYDSNPGMVEQAQKIRSNVKFFPSKTDNPKLSEQQAVDFLFARTDIGDIDSDYGEFSLESIVNAAKRVKPGGWMAIPAAETFEEEFLDELRQFAVYYSSSDFVLYNEAKQSVFLNYFYVGHPVRQISFSLDISLNDFSQDDAYNLFELFARRAKIQTEGTREEIFSDYPSLLENGTIGFGEIGNPWSYDIDATGGRIVVSYFISASPKRYARLRWELGQDILSYYALKTNLVELNPIQDT